MERVRFRMNNHNSILMNIDEILQWWLASVKIDGQEVSADSKNAALRAAA
jgi:hypothetical protein